MNPIRSALGRWLADYLSHTSPSRSTGTPSDPRALSQTLRRGDVLLVEGNSRISSAIKYLTQSTWSHAALCIGPPGPGMPGHGRPDALPLFVEADLQAGVRTVDLSEFIALSSRICRPVGLSAADIDRVCDFALARVGHAYDLKHVIDLARYLLPNPPVPVRWRRRLLALGSGDPTRAICSTLVAQSFQSVRYPILPSVSTATDTLAQIQSVQNAQTLIHHIRHHSLFTPRDFDLSPYFNVVKPNLATHFDPRRIRWADQPPAPAAKPDPAGAATALTFPL